MVAIPQPPRVTGKVDEDLVSLVQWLHDFYKATVLEKAFLQSAEQFDPSTFDPSDLPDPASTTVAKAQDTANEAFILASSAKALAQAAQDDMDDQIFGEITVSGANPSATHTFAEAQPDTSYSVVLAAKSKTGTPATGAYEIAEQTYTTADFTITVEAAPGVGNSVTFVWHLRR